MKFKLYYSNGLHKKMKINYLWANDNSYFCDQAKNMQLDKIKYIVIHNTGNKGNDTAVNNANYFKTNKQRYAGAHFIIDRYGTIVQCAKLKNICYAVGGEFENSKKYPYFKKCRNNNSVSIELCGIVSNKPTKKQLEALQFIIEYIQERCINNKTIIRHYDVNGKQCPVRYIDDLKWYKLLKKINILK